LLLEIPNLPLDTVPDGDSEEFAVEIRRTGNPSAFSFEPRDHVDLGESLGILDFARATKLSGPRFSVSRGLGARLERGLAALLLDIHSRRHGYTEFSVPYLVTPETMTGTGQLPKFEEDLFKTGTGTRDLYLIPTAEVPLTNVHADEVLHADSLPLAYTANTPCFRSEAGSYGKDTRGLIRLHQFSKVEMVRVCHPDQSQAELGKMVRHAEACLGTRTAVPGRHPGRGRHGVLRPDHLRPRGLAAWPGPLPRDLVCSDCGTFQARRASIRMRDKDGKRSFVATLNGAGLPIGRTMAAILENHQSEDGSIAIPEALVPYVGFRAIRPDGAPET
jgi:seryl-tRNA synthetase